MQVSANLRPSLVLVAVGTADATRHAGLLKATYELADRGGNAFVDAVVVALEELE